MSSPVSVDLCAYGGWARNLRLRNDEVEVIVTLEVGPRVIRYGRVGGANLLGEIQSDLGRAGEREWKLRGGHRLWVAPEDPRRTYVPDNTALEPRVDGAVVRVTAPADAEFGLERTMVIALDPHGTDVTLTHLVRNAARASVEVAPWALTVMAPGGIEILPLPRRRPHPGDAAVSAADFAPRIAVALWPYFSFADPRVTFGDRLFRLRQDPLATAPTKIGFAHREGWAGYWNDGTLFVKRFGYEEGARYPDGGCNFETYTDANILELESLGPLVTLGPGVETSHTERWSLFTDLPAPESESIVESAFFPRISSHPPDQIG